MSMILLMLIAYLAGSVPTGKIVFANVRRILGWRAGLITLGVDIAKGFFPTLLALQLTTPTVAFFVGIAAILGHIFPVWLNFKGGKGIATGLGMVLCLYPFAAIVGSVIYILAGIVGYKSSTASLVGVVTVGALVVATQPTAWWQAVIMLVIALWALRHNLRGTLKNYESDAARP
jgi:acyl phosphate:glycerol-3-phosphate acyltransferase